MSRVRMLCEPEDLPREVHDRASFMLHAALAEAGHPTGREWNGRIWVNVPPVPDDVLDKARILVCEALGLPYEVLASDASYEPLDARDSGEAQT